MVHKSPGEMGTLEVVDSIITCPQCGARNRVGTYARTLSPVCGRCRTSLQTAIETYRNKEPSSPEPTFIHRLKGWGRPISFIGIGVILTILVVGIIPLVQRKAPLQRSGPTENRPETSAPISNVEAKKEAIPPVEITSAPEKKRRKTPPLPRPDTSTEQSTPYDLSAKVAPLPHQAPIRNRTLPNGTVIRDNGLYGQGKLTVKNGLASNAVAKLVNMRDNMCEAYFYVCANNQFTLSGINDGDYRLLFGIGEDWDQSTEFFTRNQAVSEFDKPMDFVTSQEERGDSIVKIFSVIEVTLHPVPGGNIRTHTISAKEFQKY